MGYGPRKLRYTFTGKNLTHFGGFFLVQHFFQRLHLRNLLARSIRFRRRNARYTAAESVLALLYPLLVGLGRIDASGVLKRNGVFRYLTGLTTYPDASTMRRFLVRFGTEGLVSFLRLHDALRRRMLASVKSLILDLDTTVLTVYGRQEGARIGYNPKKRGRPSYHPLLCFEGTTGDLWDASYHPGNVHPGRITLDLLTRAFDKLPTDVTQVRVRADSAFYNHNIINFLKERRAFFAISVRLSKPLKARLASLRYHHAVGDISAAEFFYQPMGWKTPERHIVIRRPQPEEPTWQLSLFQMKGYNYQVMVTNLPLTPYHLWRFYNSRSNAELIIRELKEAYALGKIPTHSWPANVAYFHLVGFAYNLLNWFKRLCLPPSYSRRSLQTIRRDLLAIPGELVYPQGIPTIRFPASYPHLELFARVLDRIQRVRLPIKAITEDIRNVPRTSINLEPG
jgi:hypothetical protein